MVRSRGYTALKLGNKTYYGRPKAPKPESPTNREDVRSLEINTLLFRRRYGAPTQLSETENRRERPIKDTGDSASSGRIYLGWRAGDGMGRGVFTPRVKVAYCEESENKHDASYCNCEFDTEGGNGFAPKSGRFKYNRPTRPPLIARKTYDRGVPMKEAGLCFRKNSTPICFALVYFNTEGRGDGPYAGPAPDCSGGGCACVILF